MIFTDRRQAGQLLADRILQQTSGRHVAGRPPLVVALPRGGVTVAYEVAARLHAPLDVLVVRKLGVPGNPEYGVGAIAEGGLRWVDTARARREGLGAEDIQRIQDREQPELERRLAHYRRGRPGLDVAGRDVILVDDGLATGVTARVASRFLRQRGARRVTLAVPVCPRTARTELRGEVDEFITLDEPSWFISVGQHYEDFEPVTDEQVTRLLDRLRDAGRGLPHEHEVWIQGPQANLRGVLSAPPAGARGAILFAHGSGSSLHSPRNRAVAAHLREAGFATLLFDLLSLEEAASYDNVFDVRLLASRLELATDWARHREELHDLPVAYFGASTGAAAALWAAAELGPAISAVVSRGGRPDLADGRLRAVRAPTLLIVGGADEPTLTFNRHALPLLERGKLAVVPEAGHLFEEKGALAQVESLALDWFIRYLHIGMRGAA